MRTHYLSTKKLFGIVSAIAVLGIMGGSLLNSPVKETLAQSLPTVFVANTPQNPVPVAVNGTASITCPQETHWDKIIFKVPVTITSNSANAAPLVATNTYAVLVSDNPNSVIDLNQQVWNFLQAHGYNLTVSVAGRTFQIQPNMLIIVSAQYAIACGQPQASSSPTS